MAVAPPVMDAALEWSARLDDLTVSPASEVLTRAYALAFERIRGDLDRLTDSLGPNPTLTELATSARLRELLDRVALETARFRDTATATTVDAVGDAVAMGAEAAAAVGEATFTADGVATTWSMLDRRAVTALAAAATDPGSPLTALLDNLGAGTADAVRDELVAGVATGANPVDVARRIRARTASMTLTRAQTIARTETLRAHRTATLAAYQANADALVGWTWIAAADARTCPACWTLHGTVWPLDEPMAAHPRCRCTMAPSTRTAAELTGDADVADGRAAIPPGPDLFARLSDDERAVILGPTRARLYADGTPLDRMLARTESDQWGPMFRTATLGEIEAGSSGWPLNYRDAPPPPRARPPKPPAPKPPRPKAPAKPPTPTPPPEPEPEPEPERKAEPDGTVTGYEQPPATKPWTRQKTTAGVQAELRARYGEDLAGDRFLDLAGMGADQANDLAEAVTGFARDYPHAWEDVRLLGSGPPVAKRITDTYRVGVRRFAPRMLGGAHDPYDPSMRARAVPGAVRFLPATGKRWDAMKADVARSAASGHFPEGATAWRSVVDHELGHSLDFFITRDAKSPTARAYLADLAEVRGRMNTEWEARMKRHATAMAEWHKDSRGEVGIRHYNRTGKVLPQPRMPRRPVSTYGWTVTDSANSHTELIAEALSDVRNSPNPDPWSVEVAAVVDRHYAATVAADADARAERVRRVAARRAERKAERDRKNADYAARLADQN